MTVKVKIRFETSDDKMFFTKLPERKFDLRDYLTDNSSQWLQTKNEDVLILVRKYYLNKSKIKHVGIGVTFEYGCEPYIKVMGNKNN